jgi:hypothetical protein
MINTNFINNWIESSHEDEDLNDEVLNIISDNIEEENLNEDKLFNDLLNEAFEEKE